MGDLARDGFRDLTLTDATFNLREGQTGEQRAAASGDPRRVGTLGANRGIGLSVAALPNVSGDGYPDVVVGDGTDAYVFAAPCRVAIRVVAAART